MTESETFKEQWPMVTAKVRDRWPKLTDEDIREIDGALDRLAQKVNDHYGWTRSEMMQELTTLLQPARRDEKDVRAGEPKLGEQVEHGGKSRR